MTRRSFVLACGAAAFAGVVGALTATAHAQKAANPIIIVETSQGAVQIELNPKWAPKGVAHILDLVNQNFYRGLRVHRVTASLVQLGDPQTRSARLKSYWGTGGSGHPLGVAEITGAMKHVRGAVGLAYAGDAKMADSQFYIMRRDSPSLDGQYSIIGRVIAGLTVIDKLQVGDDVKNVTLKK